MTIDNSEQEKIKRENAEKKVERLEIEKDAKLVKLEAENREMRESIKGLYELLGKKD